MPRTVEASVLIAVLSSFSILAASLMLPNLAALIVVSVLTAHGAYLKTDNMRLRVTTKDFCNPDLKDGHGNRAPCGISQARETYGLRLPGMEDGVLTTREDIIVTKDGQVSVKALPNYPYQFIMTVESPESKRVEHFYDHKSSVLAHTQVPSHASRLQNAGIDPGDLEAQGWTRDGVDKLNGAVVSKWLRKGPEGLDPKDGTNYTALYQTGLAPDTWVVFIDESVQQPVKLLAINTYVGSKVFQESIFEHAAPLDKELSIESAVEAMYHTYRIDSHHHLDEASVREAPFVTADYIAGDRLAERSRAFFEEHEAEDWMSGRRSLRQDTVSRGIKYFTIEENSAADFYFHASRHRQLVKVVSLEFPNGCNSGKSMDPTAKYRLVASVDASLDISGTVKGLISFTDVNKPSVKAHLSLSFEAGGCALVFQYGEVVSLTITVCISGAASGQSLLQPDKRTFHGEVDASVRFDVNLPVVGSVIHWTIGAKVGYNMANAWEFSSEVNFLASVGFWILKKTWAKSWILWQTGAVEF
ncbi:hypothetical protein FOZ60_004181 [Perkinsus olseni]|uniref:Uncharacterized protein n=1 Tax=Perkinsus olseni TaxID=32597 RepID=A0A7J6NTR7_PEROL|nr:hypothetical protein FOZ60_004181 [Perkinsus olseni]